MFSFVANGSHLPLLTSSDASTIAGYISIWTWLVPSFSQLHENYVLKSGEGLSITFIIIWLAGDALNMIGALREGLLPTMIILAGYYCLCDIALIWQYYFYRKYHDYYHPAIEDQPVSETTPLVDPSASSISIKRANQPTLGQEVFRCAIGLGLVSVAGVLTWYLTSKFGWKKHPTSPHLLDDFTKHHDQLPIEWKWDAQISGWASAFLYCAFLSTVMALRIQVLTITRLPPLISAHRTVSSRFPQIIKNRQTKCEGLSLALFVFSVAGNLTYCASILIKSLEREYIIENMSWLVGSLGTVFLDFIVLGQFVHYRDERDREERLQRDIEDAEVVG